MKGFPLNLKRIRIFHNLPSIDNFTEPDTFYYFLGFGLISVTEYEKY